MASLVPGFEYDIFISYRQKDNKGDRWVSEFVEALKTELESTFKEEISVYFDVNPHDGLLETHDINASLKEKLKCLIFIPIISRTYCDPKSFAWEHEFKAFIEQASRDQFGLKVRLPNGNVASRVLPVRIHELNNDDIKLCESALVGVLRGIEFIFKSPGVNRPLRSKEENPQDNLNRTIYRDQINKVANAISEIISGLLRLQITQAEEAKDEKSTLTDGGPGPIKVTAVQPSGEKAIKAKKKKWIYSLSSSVVVILAVVAIFLFSSGSTLPFSKRDWILITDFDNLTGDPVFDKSLYTAFSLSTSQSRYINVFPRSRMLETLAKMEIKDQTFVDEKTGREMAIRQGIGIYIAPSISETGNRYVIGAKIMETKSGILLRSEILYAEAREEILPVLDKLSRRLRRNLGESRYNIAAQDKPLADATTSSLEALKQYTLGTEYHAMRDYTNAKKYYEIALQIDTAFTSAKAILGSLNIESSNSVTGTELVRQAARSADKLTDREKINILAINALYVERDISKSIAYYKKLIELYPDDPVYHNNLGVNYERSGKFEEALTEYKTALKINPDIVIAYGGIIMIYLQNLVIVDSALVWSDKLISSNPQNAWGYLFRGLAYVSIDSLINAETAFQKAREIDPYLIVNLYNLAHTYRLQGRYQEAIRILQKIQEIDKNQDGSNYDLGVNYQLMGNKQEAKKYFSIFLKIVTEEWPKKYPDDAGRYIVLASLTARLEEMDSSKLMLQKAIEKDSTLHKQFSEVLSSQGRIPEALDELKKALDNGYRELWWLKLSPDWQALYYDIRFRNLLEKYFR
jgi:tetratricopeptide (TPR) repeat protein